jgi:hypothetical protein
MEPSSVSVNALGAKTSTFHNSVVASEKDGFEDAQDLANDLANEIFLLLQTACPLSPVVMSALHRLNVLRPTLRYRIIPEEIWGYPVFRPTLHVNSTFSDAVANVVQAIARPLDASEKEVLRQLLMHSSCWSATPTAHMSDSWVRYICAYPKTPIPGLTPILDSLVFPEDLCKYPPPFFTREPSFFLFGAPKQFYVYVFAINSLYRAGETLAEVFSGLRKPRYMGIRGWGGWEEEEISPWVDILNNENYFPEYEENHKGELCLARKLKEWPF